MKTTGNRGAERLLPKPIPERIKEAREARGYTLVSFASDLGVTRQAVAQYETGQISPSGEALSKIIALTEQPLSFFTSSPSRPGQARTLFWRSLKRMEQHHRNRISRRIQWAADLTDMVDEFVEVPEVNIPQWDFDPDSPEYGEDIEGQIESAAESLRDAWGLGIGPVTNLAQVLESNGVVIVREKVDCADMDGVSCWIAGRPYILLSGEITSGPRDLYNLAHELGHLCLHSMAEVTNKNLNKIEAQANRFASAFLMPREAFAQEVLGTSIEFFKTLKLRWGVSIAAMAYRCKDLKIITESQLAYVFRQMNLKRIRKVEPYDTAFSVARPQMLAEALKMIIENGVCSSQDVEDRLGVNLKDIESLSGLEAGFLDTRVVHLKFRNAVNEKN